MFGILLTVSLFHCVTSTPVINAPWGQLSGVRIQGKGGRAMDGYLGVPFALPPLGDLRWKKPIPHPGPRNGNVFRADTLQPGCAQEKMSTLLYAGSSEDCLTLNVFVPVHGRVKQDSLLLTMVWIHGGGFIVGDAPLYRPSRLVADEGLIVVTIQYRLGALGFLATGDPTLPGNFGLWDQQLALTWVKDNIRAFSGDPDAITLFGESAGAMSVGLQVLSPESKGLFHRAILQSGSPTIFGRNGWVVEGRTMFWKLVKALGCDREVTTEAVKCLRAKTAEEIVNAPGTLMADLQDLPSVAFYGPIVDGAFLPREPLALLQDEKYLRESGVLDMDLLTGCNSNEGAVTLLANKLSGGSWGEAASPRYLQALVRGTVDLATRHNSTQHMYQAVEFFYRGADSFTDQPTPLSTISNIQGDGLFYTPAVQWARTMAANAKRGKGKRYMYLLDHDFAFNCHTPLPGSHHGDELPLEFDILGMEKNAWFAVTNKTFDTEDIPALADLFIKAIASFAKTGNPGSSMEGTLGQKWPEFTDENEAFVALTLPPKVRVDLYKDRLALWLSLIPEMLKAASTSDTINNAFTSKGKEEL